MGLRYLGSNERPASLFLLPADIPCTCATVRAMLVLFKHSMSLHEANSRTASRGVCVSLSGTPLLAEASPRGARLSGTSLSGILMMAEDSLHGASLVGTLGLDGAWLPGALLSGTLLLSDAFLRGVSLSGTLLLAGASHIF